MNNLLQLPPLSLYIHYPWCLKKCPYCDFNSHDSEVQDGYIKALLKDLDEDLKYVQQREISSIFIGGGTPSLMNVKEVNDLFIGLNDRLDFASNIEITLEANPGTFEVDRFAEYRNVGINRLSIGVQSFNDIDLKYLGRKHSANDALAAVEIANSEFVNVNFDLIYGRQFQKLIDWEKELNFALSLGSQHLSLYQLTIENGTAFKNLFNAGKLRGLPNQKLSKEFFVVTNKLCKKNSFNQYEISNFAKENFQCFHNLNYWKCGNFISIGPGAHGRYVFNCSRFSYENINNPENWLNKSLKKKIPIQQNKKLSKLEHFEELIMMGLRINEGINLNYINEKLDMNLNNEKLKYLKNYKFISLKNNKLKLLSKGKLVLNKIIQELLV